MGSLGSRAQAQDVALDMRSCAQPRSSDVRAVLAVELQHQLLREDAAVPSSAQVVEVRCTASEAQLWLKGTNTRRTVALASVPPELRARLLALSIAELTRPRLTRPIPARAKPTAAGGPTAGVGTSESETITGADATRPADTAAEALATNEAGTARSADSTREADVADDGTTRRAGATREADATDDGTTRAADATDDSDADDDRDEEPDSEESSALDLRPPPTHFAWLGAEAQATPIFGAGGSLLFQTIAGEWLAWSSAFSIAHATTNIDRGDLSVLSLSLRTGLAFAVRSRRGSLHLGAGLRGQWQRLEGDPSDDTAAPASFSVWSVGAAAFAGATWQFAPPAFLALEVEADRLREVRARVEGGDAKPLSPWRTSAVVGAGLAW